MRIKEICPRFFVSYPTGKMIHIGKMIENELHRQERTVTWFARNLYCERTNVYHIFKRQSLDTELLLRISRLLKHDFFKYYSLEAARMPEDSAEVAVRE